MSAAGFHIIRSFCLGGGRGQEFIQSGGEASSKHLPLIELSAPNYSLEASSYLMINKHAPKPS